MKNQISRPLLLLAMTFLFLQSTTGFAQDDKSNRPSPPAQVSEEIGDATITINYSQPAVKDRTVWGELVPYGKVWRTGANEATTFEVSDDVEIEGETLPAGKYALFTIPGEDEWTIIFNKETNQWGSGKYDESKDALRVKVKPEKSDKMHERLTFQIEKDGEVELLWENLEVEFSVDTK
jgi:hypothetical protein